MPRSFMLYCWMALIAITIATGPAQAGLKTLPKGESVIETPAIGAGLCVDNLFQSNMVLQRDKPISIWGWAAAGEIVTVTFDGKEQSATAAQDRTWKVTFPALPASEQPRVMIVQGKDQKLTLENILLGDVWLAGGQSNMEFPTERIDNGDLELASANFPNVRLLTIPQNVNQEPVNVFPRIEEWSDWSKQHFHKGFWEVCTPESAREFSGIAYIFARRLYMATHIPQGVINISRGGTAVETWTPIGVLRSIDTPEVKALLAGWDTKVAQWDPKVDLQQRIDRLHERIKSGKAPADAKDPTELAPGPTVDMNRPGNCFGGMFGPISGLRVKGAIWHQGYNNAFGEETTNGDMYRQILPHMIAAWREAVGDPEMAFGIISLCTDGEPQSLEKFSTGLADNGCYIREAQFQTFLDLRKAGDKNIGYASSYDLRRNWYHPQIKIPAGERIARWAMATQYGSQIHWLAPMVKEMKLEDGKIVLQIDGDAGPYNDGPIYGFSIAGDDRKFYPATAGYPMVDGKSTSHNVILLSSPMVANPKQYRFAWNRNPMANLKSTDHTDLPMPISRSDHWTMNDLYESYVGKKSQSPTSLDRQERNALNKALQAADTARLVEEAKAFIRDHESPNTHAKNKGK